MTTRPILAALTLAFVLSSPTLTAVSSIRKGPKKDPVRDASQESNTRDKATPNEVTVVLDDEGQPPAAAAVGDAPKPAETPSAEPPVTVTGKPPEGLEAAVTPPSEPPDLAAVDPTEESPKPEDGLAVRVEKLQSGSGTIDPTQVKLTAPFPAKPLAAAPAGWRLDASDSAPPFTREVELSAGTRITLTIRPHILVPDADGANVFAIAEPGYNRSLGYRQTATVGAILSTSIRQLDEDCKQLGNAIDNLQQLLISLPKPEPQPNPETKPAALRKK
jgi:hypothetical protein